MKKNDNKAKIKVITNVTSGLETQLKKRQRRHIFSRLMTLGLLSLVPMLIYRDYQKIEEAEKHPKKVEINYWDSVGKVVLWETGAFFIFGLIGVTLLLSEKECEAMRDLVEDIESDEKLSTELNMELVKMAPTFKAMFKAISEKSEIMADVVSKGKLSEAEAEYAAQYIDRYLKENPKEAKKLLGLLDAAQLPQSVIDKYITKYVPDTLSFNVAREVEMLRK